MSARLWVSNLVISTIYPAMSCLIFLSILGLGASATIVLPVLGAIAQATDKTPVPSVIDPGFPARSFEHKVRAAASRMRLMSEAEYTARYESETL